MSGEEKPSLPPGAVESFTVPPKTALVRDGKLQIGEPRSLSNEALESVLVLAVSAALEATTAALRRSIETEKHATNDERDFHKAVADMMESCTRDREFVQSAVRFSIDLIARQKLTAQESARSSSP